MRRAPRKSQTVLEHELTVTPPPETMYPREDYFGNPAHFSPSHEPHRELIITSRSVVELDRRRRRPNLDLSPPWEKVREEARQARFARAFEAGQFVFESPKIRLGPPFAEYARQSFAPGRPLSETASNHLSERILQRSSNTTSAPPP